MPIDYVLLGQRIAFYRAKASLSQEKLADKVHVNSQHISKIERGRSRPSPDLLVDLANALNVTVDTLLIDSIQSPSAAEKLRHLLEGCSSTEGTIIMRNAENLKKILEDLDIK